MPRKYISMTTLLKIIVWLATFYTFSTLFLCQTAKYRDIDTSQTDISEGEITKNIFDNQEIAPLYTSLNGAIISQVIPSDGILNKDDLFSPNKPRNMSKLTFIPGRFIPPYVPLNNVLFHTDVKKYIKQKTSLIHSEFGLNPYKTADGEESWIENGVVYRKFPYLEKQENKYYSAPFEANIPFDPDVFFLGQKDKIEEYINNLKRQKEGKQKRVKKIIMQYIDTPARQPLYDLEQLRMCPDLPCLVTTNRAYLNESTVLIVNGQWINETTPPPWIQDKIYVYYQIEPPTENHWRFTSPKYQPQWINHRFNWTMSYRLDSDIVVPYGIIRKRRTPLVQDYDEIVNNKDGIVAWVTGNMDVQSGRNIYVQELSTHLQVDIYSYVPSCSRILDPECTDWLSKKYKFYLGFESTICQNYITEKFFKYYNLNLIVVGRGINEYSEIAPNGTYINAADFKSPKDLAQYLLYLHNNDVAYKAMLREKDKYFALYENNNVLINKKDFFLENRYESVPLCHLCHRLWNLEHYHKTVPNIMAWFLSTNCFEPSDVNKVIKEDQYNIIRSDRKIIKRRES